MNLGTFRDDIEYSRLHFTEGLFRLGFVEQARGWVGTVKHASGSTEVRVELTPAFPFRQPKVTPTDPDGTPWSWHRELDGSLCLVAEDDHENLWWSEAEVFIEHVTAWFEHADTSWAGDRPDLDLDRYFTPASDPRLYLYDELEQRVGTWVRFRPGQHHTVRLAGSGTPPRKRTKHLKDAFAYVADLGSLDTPPRSWDDLAQRLENSATLERKIRDQVLQVLALRYDRGGHPGAILLHVSPGEDSGIHVARLSSAADTRAARVARSGRASSRLTCYKVAVIGLGALGSFVADLLVRAGVTKLTLIDDDVIEPGNLVRHLVGPAAIGMSKVDAVANHLKSQHAVDLKLDPRVETANHDSVLLLVREHDLVINATAEFAVTAAVHAVSRATGKHSLSAALQNDGTTYRVDVLPPLDNASPLPDSSTSRSERSDQYFEAGCGSPISPTPPQAVVEAAAATVRHAVGLLLESPVHPSGEVRNLAPAPDTP